MNMHTPIFHGAGKGSKTPKEAPDSLFSNNIAHILDALGEGEIEGIVGDTDEDRKRSIFYNEVPLLGPNGEPNFTGVIVTANNGTPDQPAIPGFDDTRTSIAVNQDLPSNVYKTISFPNDGSVTAVGVTISAANFFEVDKDGNTNGTYVSFVIERSQNGGSFEPVYNGYIRGKQTDEFNMDYRVPISDPSGNTAIRVKRTKPESTTLKVNDAIRFKTYTRIIEHKFSYPNIATVGHILDAKQFGNQLPTRQYRARGIKAHVPHNYNAKTRAYTGPFNGTMTTGRTNKVWTNNPVWVFLELVTNKRFGLGRFFPAQLIDIPSLYQTAKWCDELVSDGKGGQEPRWTCNTVINTRGEAFNVLKDLVSCFRGSLFWMQAKLWAFGDQPRVPVKIVTNKNVIGGKFTYSGESNRQRVSAVNVSYNDPELFMRRSIETVDDPTLIREIGYKTKDFGAFGCTSRAQARRLGRAILFSQEFESELVSYSAAFDHMAVAGDGPDSIAPGDLILLADRARGNAVAGGTVRAIDGASIILDRPSGTGSGTFYVEHKDGSVELLTCNYTDVELEVDGEDEPQTFGRVTLTESSAVPTDVNDAFILIEQGYEAEPFVVLKIARPDKHLYDITAVRYDERRFAAIYDDMKVDPTKYMGLPKTDVCQPVADVVATDAFLTGVDVYSRVINVAWTRSPDPFLSHNVVSYSKDNTDWIELPIAAGTTAQITDARPGSYRIRVSAVNRAGVFAAPVYTEINIDVAPDEEVLALGEIVDLRVDSTDGTTFGGRDAKVTWKLKTPQSEYMKEAELTDDASADGIVDPMFRDCIVQVRSPDGAVLLRTESVIGTSYVYTFEKNHEDTNGAPRRAIRIDVIYRDKYARVSPVVSVQASNPPPEFTAQPVITPGLQSFTVQATKPNDTDYAGMAVYASLTSGFAPGPGNRVYDGVDVYATIPQLGNTIHYIRVVPYDAFGAGVPTGELAANPAQAGVGDTTAPLAPTGLTLTASNVTTGPTGDPVVQLVAQWNASTESDIGGYVLALSEGNNTSWVEFQLGATATRYQRDVRPNTQYYAKVKAVDRAGNPSAFSPVVSVLSGRDTVPPPAPTGMSVTVGYRQLWLSWTNPTAGDLALAEVFEASVNDSSQATLIGTVNAESAQPGKFSIPGQANSTRYYWTKAVDTSGNKSPFSAVASGTPAAVQMAEVQGQVQAAQIAAVEAGKITGQITETQIGPEAVTTPKLAARSIIAGKIAVEGIQAENIATNAVVARTIAANSIVAENVVAGSLTGDRIKAGTIEGDRFSTGTSLPGTITVGNTGVSIFTVQQQASYANDPAARINAMTTTIQPGRIAIGGSSTLVSLLTGPDNTQINGGKIATNSILTNSIRIGNRNITMQRSDFSYNPNNGTLNWSSGELLYIGDDNNPGFTTFSAGSAGWSGGTVNFVYWLPYESFLRVGVDNWPSIYSAGGVIICEWRNGGNFQVTMGGTLIDGGRIYTNTITALQIKVGSITADRLSVTSLSAISANIGYLVSYNGQGGRVERDGNGTRVYYNNGGLAVKIGF